jgi:hypothetical protein
MESISQAEHFREIAQRYSVSYQVYPESRVLRDGTLRQVGFCLELYGRNGDGRPLSPGDERAAEIYRGLRQIALQIAPQQAEACYYQVDGSNSLLVYGNPSSPRGSVLLEIHILHSDDCERPLDEDEIHALHEVEERLQELEVHRGARG